MIDNVGDVTEAPLPLSVSAVHRRGLSVHERRLLLMGLDAVAVSLALILAFNLHTAEVRHAGFFIPRLGTLIVLALWAVSGTIVDAWDIRAAVSVRLTLPRGSHWLACWWCSWWSRTRSPGPP